MLVNVKECFNITLEKHKDLLAKEIELIDTTSLTKNEVTAKIYGIILGAATVIAGDMLVEYDERLKKILIEKSLI